MWTCCLADTTVETGVVKKEPVDVDVEKPIDNTAQKLTPPKSVADTG